VPDPAVEPDGLKVRKDKPLDEARDFSKGIALTGYWLYFKINVCL
jgi:hypothetical protein